MNLVQLALKEWQRRPLRTTITAGGVAIATAALYSLLAFQRGYRDGLRQELDRLGAHVLLVPKGCPYDAASMALHGANWPCYLKEKYLEEVRSVAGVDVAAPVFMAAIYGDQARNTVYVGVDTNSLALKKSWRITGNFPSQRGTVMAGAEAARRYGWTVGMQVPLPNLSGETAMVAGILNPSQAAEDAFIYLPLTDAQQRFHHSNELTHILVRLRDPNDLDWAVAQLRGCDAGLSMNVVPLAHVFHTIQSLVNSTRVLLGCLAAVALLVAGSGVSNTILMAVTERARDLGIMRALGASKRDIFQLIWLETVQVCVIGAGAGILAAWLCSSLVEAWVRSRLPFSPPNALIRWEWWVAAACFGSALVLGSLAGFLPARRAAAAPPILTIRAAGGRL